MSEVPKHLQSQSNYYPTQKAAKAAYKASLTPEKKAEIKKKKKEEKDKDKRQAESVKKSKAATVRRVKEKSKMKTLTFPGYRK